MPRSDADRLAEIRAVLAAFDWELDDRQYALEEIDRIAGTADGQLAALDQDAAAEAGDPDE